jgi:hypothetical protein
MSVPIADTGTFSESASVAVQATDTGSATDETSLVAAVFGSDTAAAAEFAGLASLIGTADVSSGTDRVLVGVAAHDTAHGTDAGQLGGVYREVPVLPGWQTTVQGSAQTEGSAGYTSTAKGSVTVKDSFGRAD